MTRQNYHLSPNVSRLRVVVSNTHAKDHPASHRRPPAVLHLTSEYTLHTQDHPTYAGYRATDQYSNMPCRCTQIYYDDSFVWELGSYTVVSIIVVALRLAVRFRVRGLRPRGDDYMAVVVLLSFFSQIGTSLVTFYCGSPDYTGRDLKDFRPCEINRITTTKKLQVRLKSRNVDP